MSVIKRINRLFQADVNGILDQLEEPQAILRQSVREMESLVADDEAKFAMIERRKQYFQSLKAEIENRIRDLNEEVHLSLGASNEGLCRSLLKKKLEEENRREELIRSLTLTESSCQEIKKKLDSKREQLQTLLKKIEILGPTDSIFDAESESQTTYRKFERKSTAVTDEDVEIAFLKLMQERKNSS